MRGALFSLSGAIALLLSLPALAETNNPNVSVVQPIDSKGNILGAGKQESFALVTANVAASAGSVYGGDYIFAQTCSAYGTVALQVLGPDGVSYQTIQSKSASDTTGGTGIALGSNSVVKVLLTGTTGCNALLSRVP